MPDIEKELIKAYDSTYKQINSQIADIYAKYSKDGTLSHSDMAKYDRLTKLNKQVRSELIQLTGKNKRDLDKNLKFAYEDSYYREAFKIESGAQAKLRYTQLNPKVVKSAIQNDLANLALQRNRANVITNINQSIAQSLIAGESYPKVARRVKQALESNMNNAMRIARTELHRCQQQGVKNSIEHAEKQGVKMVKMWVATLDGRTRDKHQKLDGQRVPTDKPFKINGDELMYPGDPAGSAENVINCRCTMVSIIEGFEPEVRRVRKEGTIPYKTYEDWKAERIG